MATFATIAKTMGLESEPTPQEISISATQFRPGQFAKCVIAYVDDKEAGFAVFFYDYSTVYLQVRLLIVVGFCAGNIFRGFIR